jgi:hypothetical protein
MGWTTLLALVATLNIFYWMQLGFKEIEHWMKPQISKVGEAPFQVPSFRIEHGRAMSNLPQPHYSNTNHFPIILDLKSEIEKPESQFPQGIVISREQFKFWLEGTQVLSAPWTGWPDGEVNAAYIELIEKETFRLWPLVMMVVWFLFIAGGLIQALFFTIFVSFLEKTVQPSFTFQQIFNVALFAMVPSSLIVATYVSFQVNLVGLGLLYFCAYCFMMVTASNACRASLRPPSSTDTGLDL